jgi:hypothetical protein
MGDEPDGKINGGDSIIVKYGGKEKKKKTIW